MKFFLKLILIPILFLFALFIFLPKQNIYNLAEKELSKKGIIVSGEIVREKSFGLRLRGAEVYFEGINTAFLRKLNLDSYLFYSKVELYDLRVSKSFTNILPSKVSNVFLEHSVLNPAIIKINADGDFGSFEGEVQILNRKILGELKPSNIMKSRYRNILNQFKLVEGKYQYEYKF